MQMAYGENQWGRWMTPDLLGGDIANPQSLNRYAYALNNPTTLTDPQGLDPSGCTSQIDENGNPYVSCSGPDTVTVNGGEPPSLGLIMCELGFGGCGQTTITGPVTGYGQSVGGGGGGGAPAPKPAPPAAMPAAPNQMIKCIGSARVLQGNAATIGQPGGFSGPSAGNIPVTPNGAAIVPSQWGGKAALRPFLNQIGGFFPL